MSNTLVNPKKAIIQRHANPLRKPSRPIRKPANNQNKSSAPGSSNTSTTTSTPKVSAGRRTNTPTINSKNKPSSSSSTAPPSSNAKDYKLNACSAEDINGLRYHLMKFHSRHPVDPSHDFTTPIRLHRKDTRNIQSHLTLSELEERNKRMGITTAIPKHLELEEAEDALSTAPASDSESKLLVGDSGGALNGTIKTENGDSDMKDVTNETDGKANGNVKEDSKQKDKVAPEEADMSRIAPDGGARRAKSHLFQKKTRQVVLGDPEARKIRYEEYYPWVMEDFDGKNTWVGNYEGGQKDSYVLFVFDKDGFKMVPAEKWYRMTPRNKYATLTSEEVEKQMAKGEQPNRWIMKHFGNEGEDVAKRPMNMRRRFRTTDISNYDDDSRRHDDDGNEIDFDDEFADDEEAPIMDGNEEDVKEVEKKIKKEQQNAKVSFLFDDNNNEGDDEDENKVDKQGRHMIKYLRSREKNANYETDEESNPYASDESSEEEEEIYNADLGKGTNGNGNDPSNGNKGIKQEPGADGTNANGNVTSTGPANTSAAVSSVASKPGTNNTVAETKNKKEKKTKEKKLKKEKKKKTSQKKHLDLPKGMIILNLPSSKLAEFPHNLWNPGLKRRRAEISEGEDSSNSVRPPKSKKLKVMASKSEERTVSSSASAAIVSANSVRSVSASPVPGNLTNGSNITSREETPAILQNVENSLSSRVGSSSPRSSPVPPNTEANGSVNNNSNNIGGDSITVNGGGEPVNADLLTEEEVVAIIRRQRTTAKDLLAELKHRMKKHPDNPARLKKFVKQVAKLHDGYLVFKSTNST